MKNTGKQVETYGVDYIHSFETGTENLERRIVRQSALRLYVTSDRERGVTKKKKKTINLRRDDHPTKKFEQYK